MTETDPVTAPHRMSVRRHQKGKSPIGRGSPLYGCSGLCTCGWTGRSNSAPSRGGRAELQSAHLAATGTRADLA